MTDTTMTAPTPTRDELNKLNSALIGATYKAKERDAEAARAASAYLAAAYHDRPYPEDVRATRAEDRRAKRRARRAWRLVNSTHKAYADMREALGLRTWPMEGDSDFV